MSPCSVMDPMSQSLTQLGYSCTAHLHFLMEQSSTEVCCTCPRSCSSFQASIVFLFYSKCMKGIHNNTRCMQKNKTYNLSCCNLLKTSIKSVVTRKIKWIVYRKRPGNQVRHWCILECRDKSTSHCLTTFYTHAM